MKIFVTREISGGRRKIELLSLYVYQNQTLNWKLLSDSELSLEEIRYRQSQSGLPLISWDARYCEFVVKSLGRSMVLKYWWMKWARETCTLCNLGLLDKYSHALIRKLWCFFSLRNLYEWTNISWNLIMSTEYWLTAAKMLSILFDSYSLSSTKYSKSPAVLTEHLGQVGFLIKWDK